MNSDAGAANGGWENAVVEGAQGQGDAMPSNWVDFTESDGTPLDQTSSDDSREADGMDWGDQNGTADAGMDQAQDHHGGIV